MRRGFSLHLGLLLAGAFLVLWGSTRPWITWTVPDRVSLAVRHGHASGSDLRPLMEAMGWVALAGVPALVALRRAAARRWFGTVLGASTGLLALGGAVDALAYRRRPRLADLVTPFLGEGSCDGCLQGRAAPWLGPSLVVAGALLLLAAALIAFRSGSSWPGLGSSYEAPGAQAPEPVTDKGVWDALDRGDDPTA